MSFLLELKSSSSCGKEQKAGDKKDTSFSKPTGKSSVPRPSFFLSWLFFTIPNHLVVFTQRFPSYVLWQIMGFKIFDGYIKLIFDSPPTQIDHPIWGSFTWCLSFRESIWDWDSLQRQRCIVYVQWAAFYLTALLGAWSEVLGADVVISTTSHVYCG